jgi:hypothetical protein
MEVCVTISINQLIVSTKAGAGAVIGTLSQIDSSGTARQTNFSLDEGSAGFFGVSGNNLVTLRAAIPPANYAVKVYGNAEYVPLSDDASFVITVTAT